MRRLECLIAVSLVVSVGPAALHAQQRASVQDQQAIELVAATYLKRQYRAVFANWSVDASWALDPRVYVFPARGLSREDLKRARDSIGRGPPGQASQRSAEMVVGRTAAHLQTVAQLFGVGSVLNDGPACKVTAADLCRLGSHKGIIWINSAFADRAKGQIGVSLLARYMGRAVDGSQAEKVAGVSWVCELERQGEGAAASWAVVTCGQFQT